MENHPAPDAWHELNPATMPDALATHVIRLQQEHAYDAIEHTVTVDWRAPAESFYEDELEVSDRQAFESLLPAEGEDRERALEGLIAATGRHENRIIRLGAMVAETPTLAAELVTAAARSEDDWSMCTALIATEMAAQKVQMTAEEEDPRMLVFRDAGRQGQALLGIPEHINTVQTAGGAYEVMGKHADTVSFKDALTYAGTTFHGFNPFDMDFTERGPIVAQEVAQLAREVRPDSIELFRHTNSLEAIQQVDDYKRQEATVDGAENEKVTRSFNSLITKYAYEPDGMEMVASVHDALVTAGIKPVDSARYIAGNRTLISALRQHATTDQEWLPKMAHTLARLDRAGLAETVCIDDGNDPFSSSPYGGAIYRPELFRDIDPMVTHDRLKELPIADPKLVRELSLVAYKAEVQLSDLASQADAEAPFNSPESVSIGESIRLASLERTLQHVGQVIDYARGDGDREAVEVLLRAGLFEPSALIGTDEATLLKAPLGEVPLDNAAVGRLLDLSGKDALQITKMLIDKSRGLDEATATRLGFDDFAKVQYEASFDETLAIDLDNFLQLAEQQNPYIAALRAETLLKSGRVANDDRLANVLIDGYQSVLLEPLVGDQTVFAPGSLSANIADRLAAEGMAKTVFEHVATFDQPDLAGILEREIAEGRLSMIKMLQPGQVSSTELRGMFERTAESYLTGDGNSEPLVWPRVTFLGVMQELGREVQPSFIRRALDTCGTGLTNGMAETFRRVEAGEIGPELQMLGLTNQGEAGLRELTAGVIETATHYRSEPIGATELEGLANSSILRSILGSMTKYEISEFGSGGDEQLLDLIDAIKDIAPDIAPTTYPTSRVYEVGLLRKPKLIDWAKAEDVTARYDQLTSELAEARDKGGNKAMDRLQTAIRQTARSLEQALESDSLNEFVRASMSARAAYLRELVTPADPQRPRTTTPIRDLKNFQQNFMELSKSRELHGPLRTAVFSWALAKNPGWRGRLAAAEQAGIGTDSVVAVSTFVDQIVNQETFKNYFSNKKAASTFRDMTSVKSLQTGLLRAQGVGVGRDSVPIQFEPRRDLMMELSGNIADACWANKYDSIAKQYPNMTAVMMKQDPGTVKEKLIGAGMLIEAKSRKGEPVLVIRGLNPVENAINKISVEQFTEAFIDYARGVADAKGMRLGITIDDHSGGSASNRPVLFEHLLQMRDDLRRLRVTHDSTEFNGYDITHNVYAL